jgi:type I restriction enzyme, S subunit
MSKEWPTAKLGQVLTRSEETIAIQLDAEYRELTVRLWGKGVVPRGVIMGAELAASRRFVARAGQFVLSRIDARNGALGLVPKELDGAIVTNDFPVFAIDEMKLLPAFFGWLSHTANFVEMCKRASEGTTNRVRLQEDRFLRLEIPLPPLPEQRRIIARIEKLSAQIEEACRLRREAAEEAEATIHAALTSIIHDLESDPFTEHSPIPLFAQINPPRPGKLSLALNEPVTFVPMKAVDDITGTIARPESRLFTDVSRGYTYFQEGDVIWARITPCMQNGKAAIARNLLNGVGFGSTEFHVLRPGPKVTAEWLYELVRHKAFREDAAKHFKGTAGQQRVPESFLKQKVIAVPPLPEQRRIVAELNALQAEVDALKKLQAETAAELDALLPAILDRAFKGEL